MEKRNLTKDNYAVIIGSSADDAPAHIEDESPLSPVNSEIFDIVSTLRKQEYHTLVFLTTQGYRDIWWYTASTLRNMVIKIDSAVLDVTQSSILGSSGYRGLAFLPRDSFVQSDDDLYLNRGILKDYRKGYTNYNLPTGMYRLLERFFNEETKNIKVSPWGEGGRWIEFNGFIIASSSLKKTLGVKRQDYRFRNKPVFFLEPVAVTIGSELILPHEYRWHIDYGVNGLDLPDNSPLIVIDPLMFENNKRQFSRLEKIFKAESVIIDPSETNRIPANFLSLPDGRLLSSPDAPQTLARIEAIIGRQNVSVTQKPLLHLREERYGIRCITNLLSLKKHKIPLIPLLE